MQGPGRRRSEGICLLRSNPALRTLTMRPGKNAPVPGGVLPGSSAEERGSEKFLTGIWSKAGQGSVVVLRVADALARVIDSE